MALGDGWISSFGFDATLAQVRAVNRFWVANRGKVPVESIMKAVSPESSLCFRESYMFHVGHPFRFPLFERRVPEATLWLRELRRRMANCYGIDPERKPNTKIPKLLFLTRSFNRRVANMSSIFPQLVRYWKTALGGGEVTVFEDYLRTPVAQTVKAFLEADVIVGTPGSQHTFAGIGTRGAIVAEVCPGIYACPSYVTGFNRVPHCDFAGDAMAAGLVHLSVATLLSPEEQVRDMAIVSFHDWKLVLDSMVCALRRTNDSELENECLEPLKRLERPLKPNPEPSH